MQMQNCCGPHGGSRLFLLTVKGSSYKHAGTHKAGVPHFDTDLCAANIRVQNWPNVADSSRKNLIRISVKTYIRPFAKPYIGEIVFVYITEHPHILQIRDSERIRRTEPGDSSGIGDLLIGDDAGNRGVNFHNTGRAI